MSRVLRSRRSSSVSILPGTGRCPQGGGAESSPITPWFELESFRPLRQPAAATSPFRGGFCGRYARYPINASAICTALSAAPLRRLSSTTDSARPCGAGCPGALGQHRYNRSHKSGRIGDNGRDRHGGHGPRPSHAPAHCKCICCSAAGTISARRCAAEIRRAAHLPGPRPCAQRRAAPLDRTIRSSCKPARRQSARL